METLERERHKVLDAETLADHDTQILDRELVDRD